MAAAARRAPLSRRGRCAAARLPVPPLCFTDRAGWGWGAERESRVHGVHEAKATASSQLGAAGPRSPCYSSLKSVHACPCGHWGGRHFLFRTVAGNCRATGWHSLLCANTVPVRAHMHGYVHLHTNTRPHSHVCSHTLHACACSYTFTDVCAHTGPRITAGSCSRTCFHTHTKEHAWAWPRTLKGTARGHPLPKSVVTKGRIPILDVVYVRLVTPVFTLFIN